MQREAELWRRSGVTGTCEQLSFVVVGHVDHGKSTLVGRLLADVGALPDGKVEQVRNFCHKNSRPFEYAFLLDTLKDEQAQGITIDTTRIFFTTPRRRYMILDAPGHIEFLKNMVTGAAKADAALLVIDAVEGVRENSKRHGRLLSLLGIDQVAVLVNKMDLVGYSEKVFGEIQRAYSSYLEQLGVRPRGFIPTAAYSGENVAIRSRRMDWYEGLIALEMIESFHGHSSTRELPFRMPVQDVYKFTKNGDDRRIVAGTVESGTLQAGDSILFYPSLKRSTIKRLERWSSPEELGCTVGEAIGFTMNEQVYVQRGEIACKQEETAPQIGTRVCATLFWLGKAPLIRGKRYLLKLGTARRGARLHRVERAVDSARLESSVKDSVNTHDVAECIFDLESPLAFENSADHKTLSRFALFDGYDLSGGGVIRSVLEDPLKDHKNQIATRDLKWETSLISSEAREERYGHPASLLIITGPKASDKKDIAKELERILFELRYSVYYLGFGSLRYGVGSRNLSENQQQIRQLAEVARLFLDAGLILIVSIAEMTASDRELMELTLRTRNLKIFWVGDQVTTDLVPDGFLGSDVESAHTEILRMADADHLLKKVSKQ